MVEVDCPMEARWQQTASGHHPLLLLLDIAIASCHCPLFLSIAITSCHAYFWHYHCFFSCPWMLSGSKLKVAKYPAAFCQLLQMAIAIISCHGNYCLPCPSLQIVSSSLNLVDVICPLQLRAQESTTQGTVLS